MPDARRGKLDVYFTRVYNPMWTNPDGFTWLEVLRDESKIGLHVALTPTWSETAWWADYVLPMGLGSERLDNPITVLSGTVPLPGDCRCSRESSDTYRLSPITHSRPAGTLKRK